MLGTLFRPVRVGGLFGIPILVSPVVILLTLLILANAASPEEVGQRRLVWVVIMLAGLAVSLLVHELAHALVARRLGLHVVDITIWPFGGMARMETVNHRPELEAPIALAGPAVNLLMSGALFAAAQAVPASEGLELGARDWLSWLAVLNLVLGAGNLVPAFPLDGGRVLRAWLARNAPTADATRAARSTATLVSFACLIVAIQLDVWLLGLVLFVYVWWAGQMELLQVVMSSQRAPSMPVGEVYRRSFQRRRVAGADHGPRREEDRPRPEPESGEIEVEAEPAASELEDFRGSLSEWFRLRRRR